MNKVEIRYWLGDGYCNRYVIDDRCNILSYKNSSGYWYEYVRDDRGNGLRCNDSNGKDIRYE